MRYRPFTSEGRSSSAVSLVLKRGLGAAEAFQLVCAALECGVNTFSFASGDEAAAEALRRALSSVGRRVLILILRLELDGTPFGQQARAALRASGATYLDAAMVDRPGAGALSAAMLAELQALRAERLAVRVALACDPEASACLDAFDFDILALRYNVTSGWAERNMLKAASQRGLTVIGYGSHLDRAEPAGAPIVRGLTRLFRREPDAVAQVYGFLDETPDWTSDQITLAFALTEPGLATILTEADSPKAIEALAAVVERELPSGVAAQIEMARFAANTRRGAA